MNVNSHDIYGFVDITAGAINHELNGIFESVNQPSIAKISLYVDKNKKIENLEALDYDTLLSYQLKPVTGIIKETVNSYDVPVTNTRVSFIQDLTTDKSSLEYNGDKVVVDYCITDQNGQYIVFIKPGNYTIRIDNGKEPKFFYNQKIDNGLDRQYFYFIESLIKTKYDDIIEFCGTTKKLIRGTMYDQNDKPLPDAELIVSQNDQIIAYVITDINGKYMFALDNGIYDVRIRAENQPIKIAKNFEFVDGQGFSTKLIKDFSLFRKDDWVWISSYN